MRQSKFDVSFMHNWPQTLYFSMTTTNTSQVLILNEFVFATIQVKTIVILINIIMLETIDKTFIFLCALKIVFGIIFSIKLLDKNHSLKYFEKFRKTIHRSKMQHMHSVSILVAITYYAINTMNEIIIQSTANTYNHYHDIIDLIIEYYVFQIHVKYLHTTTAIKFYNYCFLCIKCLCLTHTIYVKYNFMLIVIARIGSTFNFYLLSLIKMVQTRIKTIKIPPGSVSSTKAL